MVSRKTWKETQKKKGVFLYFLYEMEENFKVRPCEICDVQNKCSQQLKLFKKGKKSSKQKKSTHHFLLVDRKTPIRFNKHGAQPHILWVSALILRWKQLCQTRTVYNVKAQLTKGLSKPRFPQSIRCLTGSNEASSSFGTECCLTRIWSAAFTAVH